MLGACPEADPPDAQGLKVFSKMAVEQQSRALMHQKKCKGANKHIQVCMH